MPTEKPRVQLTFEDNEKDMLDEIASDRGLSLSRTLGQLIREEHRRLKKRQKSSESP